MNTLATPKTDLSAFDISSLDVKATSEEGVDIPIFSPKTQLRTGLIIRVQGAFSSRFRELMAKQKQREAIKARSAVARAVANDDDDDTAEVLAEVTLGWWTVTGKDAEGKDVKIPVMIEQGQQLTFSKAEAKRVYQDYALIRGQVLAGAMDVANFIPD